MTEGSEVVVVEPAPAPAPARAEAGSGRLLLLCDHASNRLPSGFGGVPNDILSDHYGWDIGALGIARVVARELSARGLSGGLVRSNFSRLVIDPNRSLAAEDLIRQDLGVEMNAKIGEQERQRRISLFYEPYHRAIDDILDADREIAGGIVGVIAIHTFTPIFEGVRRQWDAGLIYDVGRKADVACASFLMAFLQGEGFCVGDNEPYPILEGDSLMLHGGRRELLGVGIEVRNDQVRVGETQEEWGGRLARGLERWLAQGEENKPNAHGTHRPDDPSLTTQA